MEIAGGTTDSAVVAEDTTEGVQIAEDVGFGNWTHQLADRQPLRHSFASPTTLVFKFLCIGDNCMFFCWGGVNEK